jgi:threonine dehydratase
MSEKRYFPALNDVMSAEHTLKEILEPTPLLHNHNLSMKYGAEVALKREDLQMVRSYKIRGAYNKIRSLTKEQTERGIVCASAGNHAQGVALSCNKLGIKGKIFMPVTTPKQKINQVKMFGGDAIEVVLVGDTFDQANTAAIETSQSEGKTFIPPFNDPKIIEGQGTVGLEILQQSSAPIDYIFVPIGGGGLASGIGAVYKQMSPNTKIIGVEPAGAAGMKLSFERGEVTELDHVEKFVDGAAVQRVGDITFDVCREVLDDIITIPEGKVCTTILNLYNFNAIVVEPAGALSISALDYYREQIKGKNVVCVVSGSNNDIVRMEDIKERSLLYEGLKHYFVVRFPQRAGALQKFMH